MKRAVTILLSGGYLFLALALAALFWRADAGWGAGAAALIAALGLFFSLHNMIARGMSAGELRRELEDLRDAHGLLTDQLERTQKALNAMSDRLHRETESRAEALTSEVRLLEDLVARIGETVEAERVEKARPAPSGRRSASMQDAADDLWGEAAPRASGLASAVREALEDNRIDLYLQPVVSLPQRRTVFYESYSRLRDASGRVIMPAEYLSVAEPGGLISSIDNLLLFRCVQIVRKLGRQDRRIGIFCNISPASLGDETFFPQFLEFMGRNRDVASQLIFELGQEAFEERSSIEGRNMQRLADLGVRFSIDKTTALDFDFADLKRANVRFVKIGAELLLKQLLDEDVRRASPSLADLHYSDYAALTRRYGVEIIAEKVERERQVVDILDLEVGYGQGNLFGEPRAIRESFLQESPDPTPAPAAQPAREPELTPEERRRADRRRALGL